VQTRGFPVFDADNHMYETRDAFTKFLPARYRNAVDYVDVRGRTKIVIRGQISDAGTYDSFESELWRLILLSRKAPGSRFPGTGMHALQGSHN